MEEDWRLAGRENWLNTDFYGITLYRKKYKSPGESWDHDHCEFCMAKFTEPDLIPEALHEGYVDLYNCWICETCVNDFREKFAWTIVEREE